MNVLRLEMGSFQITQGHSFGNRATVVEMGGKFSTVNFQAKTLWQEEWHLSPAAGPQVW